MRLTVIAPLAIVLAAAPAFATDMLDIAGPYGNPAGCAYALENEYGDDTLLMLTPQEYSSFATSCEFLQALPARDGSRVTTMLCGHEGEIYQTIEFMRIARVDGADAYDLFSEHGDTIGRVERCQ